MAENIYYELIDKLNQYPAGAPKTEKFVELLKTLFTEEEAEVGAGIPLLPTPLSGISEALGRDEETRNPRRAQEQPARADDHNNAGKRKAVGAKANDQCTRCP